MRKKKVMKMKTEQAPATERVVGSFHFKSSEKPELSADVRLNVRRKRLIAFIVASGFEFGTLFAVLTTTLICLKFDKPAIAGVLAILTCALELRFCVDVLLRLHDDTMPVRKVSAGSMIDVAVWTTLYTSLIPIRAAITVSVEFCKLLATGYPRQHSPGLNMFRQVSNEVEKGYAAGLATIR